VVILGHRDTSVIPEICIWNYKRPEEIYGAFLIGILIGMFSFALFVLQLCYSL
jgi:hypothetical protein